MKKLKKIICYLLIGNLLLVLSACNNASASTEAESIGNAMAEPAVETSEEITSEEDSDNEIAPEDDDREKRLMKIVYTDENGAEEILWEYAYDEEGRIVAVNKNSGDTKVKVECSYDANGRIEKITQKEGNYLSTKLKFTYDEQGNTTIDVDDDETKTSESYYLDETEDENGNLLVSWAGFPYNYDKNGRLVSHEYYKRSYGYLKRYKDKYQYDSNGNLTKKQTFEIIDGDTYLEEEIKNTYDDKGNLLTKYDEHFWDINMFDYGSMYEYIYDEEGNLTAEKKYRKRSDDKNYIFHNEDIYAYDDAGRMISKTEKDADGGIWWSYEYSYDESGNLQYESVYFNEKKSGEAEYNKDGKLLKILGFDDNGNKNYESIFDKNGNYLYEVYLDEDENETSEKWEHVYELGAPKMVEVGQSEKEIIEFFAYYAKVIYEPVNYSQVTPDSYWNL